MHRLCCNWHCLGFLSWVRSGARKDFSAVEGAYPRREHYALQIVALPRAISNKKASKAMIRDVLITIVIATIVAVASLALFTPGKAEMVWPVIRGSPMRYYVYAVHIDETRNRLLSVFDNRSEAGAMEQELQSSAKGNDTYFIRMFPAQNVEEARIKADQMRPIPLMFH